MKPALLLYPHISAYPVLLLTGFVAGWWLARRRAALFGIQRSDLDNLCLLLPIAGLFGARFFARYFYAKVSFLEALQFWKGDGLVFYGGFVACFLVILAYALLRRMKIIPLLDCLAPSLALGLAFGRIGCFLAGCCWGDVCVAPAQLASIKDQEVVSRIHSIPAISSEDNPVAVTFPQRSEARRQHEKLGLIGAGETRSLPVHPVQLYEAALAFALCWLLHKGAARLRQPGDAAIAMLLGYALIRFCTEFFRADNKLAYWGMTFSQVTSLWIAAAALLLLFARTLFLKKPAVVRIAAA